MASLAAFLIALPSLPILMISAVVGVIGFGLLLWMCLFIPALLGIILLQLPLKVLLSRTEWSEDRSRGVLTLANCFITIGLWQAGTGGSVDLAWSAVLAGIASISTQIWYVLDDRAVFGTQRYVTWRRHG